MDEMGKNFWWKTIGIVIGCAVLGLISWLVFTGLAYRLGAFGALVIVFAVLMAFAYRSDKKKAREYEDEWARGGRLAESTAGEACVAVGRRAAVVLDGHVDRGVVAGTGEREVELDVARRRREGPYRLHLAARIAAQDPHLVVVAARRGRNVLE